MVSGRLSFEIRVTVTTVLFFEESLFPILKKSETGGYSTFTVSPVRASMVFAVYLLQAIKVFLSGLTCLMLFVRKALYGVNNDPFMPFGSLVIFGLP